ncbi:hypothetical protein [Apis mellifera associated microvirus 26]|nr:hypothetical protein [Apis mellifera associated microvirus 26]
MTGLKKILGTPKGVPHTQQGESYETPQNEQKRIEAKLQKEHRRSKTKLFPTFHAWWHSTVKTNHSKKEKASYSAVYKTPKTWL